MTKEVINIHIADVLERIQSVDRLINMYKQTEHEDGSMFMIKQYIVRKEEFVQRLNKLRKKVLKLEQMPTPKKLKKAYPYEPLLASFAHEGEHPYGKKDNLA